MTLIGREILVTGATGFLGGALVRRLASDGVHVRALARRPQNAAYIKDLPNVTIVEGDITDAERMKQLAQACSIIFHVAAALGGNFEKQYHINVNGTRNVIAAAAESKVERVVHVSSIAVYGYHYNGNIDESFGQRPGRVPYNRTKSQAEAVVREIGEQSHVGYSIIRPGMIYGPRSNGWTATMFKLGKLNPTPFLGDGHGNAHPIYVDDVVELMMLLATHPAALGEAFNCSSDPAPTWREFLGGYSRLAGHDGWFGIPPLVMRPIAPLIELFLMLRGEPQELPTLVDFLQAAKTYKMTKARDLLGWQPKTDLQTGINNCVPWLREQGLLS
ncbi:MAG: SDR family NAD(P)-dependent oxidoreductase [Anaerolineaceae bacterium]|nr:SDR family NAD(P)-dependent oxidoreductase [Anaerolineaceae bacterium]